MRFAAVSLLLPTLVLGCAAVKLQKAQPVRPDDLHFHNLQVFPQNIGRDELITHMRSYTAALGVSCAYCHKRIAPDSAPEPHLDFASDELPQKHAARVMIRMTNDMNANYIPKIEEMYTAVSCWTCHRGQRRPDVAPSVPE